MARTINEQMFAEKRNEILDAALKLVYVKGYERMTIQDIISEIQISSGAFYHYFHSKQAVLEAAIERIQQESEKPLVSVIHDPRLTALEKLHRFFTTLDQMRIDQKSSVIELLRVWFTDNNAIVRQKVDEAVTERRTPLLNEVVYQGIREGVFTTRYPDQAGEIILSMLQGMGYTHARLLLSIDHISKEESCIQAIVNTHAAYMDAIERVLGAPSGCLYRNNTESVRVWVTALRTSELDEGLIS
jgi:AcrR family transcriptional regulator